jgi:hypothetical protein
MRESLQVVYTTDGTGAIEVQRDTLDEIVEDATGYAEQGVDPRIALRDIITSYGGEGLMTLAVYGLLAAVGTAHGEGIESEAEFRLMRHLGQLSELLEEK